MFALLMTLAALALDEPKPAPAPEPIVRQATMKLDGRDLACSSTAGTLALKPDFSEARKLLGEATR